MARMMHRIVYCHLQQIQEMEKLAKSAPGNGNSAETIEGDCGKERGRGNKKTTGQKSGYSEDGNQGKAAEHVDQRLALDGAL